MSTPRWVSGGGIGVARFLPGEACYPERTSMVRRFGQIVAMLTVLTATVYAQCSLSCALLNAPIQPQTQDHSCCPHHGSGDGNAPGHSCKTASAHSTEVRLDGGGIGTASVDFG